MLSSALYTLCPLSIAVRPSEISTHTAMPPPELLHAFFHVLIEADLLQAQVHLLLVSVVEGKDGGGQLSRKVAERRKRRGSPR